MHIYIYIYIYIYNLKKLIKVLICFKSPETPASIDVILTNA